MMNKIYKVGDVINDWVLIEKSIKTYANGNIIYKAVHNKTGKIALGTPYLFRTNKVSSGAVRKGKHHGEIVNGWLLEDIGLKVGNSRNTKYKGIHQETGKVGFGAYGEFKLGKVSNKVKVKEQPKKKKINVSDIVDIKQTLEAQLNKIVNVAKTKGYTITYTIE